MERYKALVEKGKAKASDKPAFQFVSEAQRSAALEFQPEASKPVPTQKVRFLSCLHPILKRFVAFAPIGASNRILNWRSPPLRFPVFT